MEKYFEEWDGKQFPVREVMFDVCHCMVEEIINVADVELWDAIEDAYVNREHPLHAEAVDLDNDIYFYCDYGFIESDPTDEEIVEYLTKHGC